MSTSIKPSKIKGTVKNRKILAVILAAIFFCLLASWGVYQALTPQRTTIYVFNKNYTAGTLVTENMLSSVEVDSNIVAASNQLSTGDYFVTQKNYRNTLSSAGVLRSDVYSGNPLMTSMLTTTGGNSIEMVMKSNAVAVTVGANYITGITNEISSGSRVNVYASYNDSTTLILESIRVLSVGRENGTISSVTLEVDINQSLQLVHGYTYGSIHLGLVDASGYQFSNSQMPTYNISGFTSANSQISTGGNQALYTDSGIPEIDGAPAQ